MTRSALCIVRSTSCRTTEFELTGVCSYAAYRAVVPLVCPCLCSYEPARVKNHYYFALIRSRAAQLEVEPGTARLRPAGRAGSFSGICAASRRLHRAVQMRACGVPLRLRHVGPGRAG